MPHGGLTITAPEGTEVYAASKGFGHRKGDVLFTVTSKMKYDTVSID
jgi:murein DD-endopeptidase MepM/ murein hydrolase activator NlpD